MKRALYPLLLIAALFLLISCRKENLSDLRSGITITVSDYPSYSDTKTLGIADPGKVSWEKGDILYFVFQTEEDSLSGEYRITHTESGWDTYERYENGEYSTVTSISVSEPSRALVFYAPNYEFAENRILVLKGGEVAGTDEFFTWTSGEGYDITDGSTLNVSFVKDYSRLRVVAQANSLVKLESSNFIPAGHNTRKLGKGSLSANADDNGNAFFYGKWIDGTDFKVSSYDGDKLLFCEEYNDRSAYTAGKSYAMNCKNTGGYTFISEIAALATSTETSVSKKIHNAVVTYVIGQYAHLEDESGAILIYNSSHGLKVGQKITGTITGKLTLYKTSPQFTSFNCSSATVTTTENIPCTTITLAELLDNFDKYIHCRILLKNITITKGISSGNTSKRSGTISQDGNSIDIYGVYTASPAVLTKGLTGDLISYPAYYNSTKRISIYVASQFTEGGIEEEEEEMDTPLTALSAIGCYSSIDDNPVATILYEEGSDQISCSKATSKRGFRFFNLNNGSYVFIDIASSSLAVGSTYQATVNTNGESESHNVMVTKKTSSKAWLEDETNNEGYIITIK